MPCKYYEHGWCEAPEDVEANDVDGQCGYMDACPQSIPMTTFIFEPPTKLLRFRDDGSDEEEHW